MSVLKSLKGSIINVQNDLKSSFRSLRSPDGKRRSSSGSATNLEQHAGADVLDRYQEYWSQIHEASESNAVLAEEVNTSVNKIYLHLEKENDDLNVFLALAADTPSLLSDIQHVITKIGDLDMVFSDLELGLLELEDLCDAQELHQNMKHHKHQLSLYKQKKELELEQVKVKLAMDHARKVEAYETKLQGKLREKQEGLEAAYKTEINNYKAYGQTQFKPSPKREPGPELADITLDTDTSELDAFLTPDDETEDTSDDLPQGEGQSGDSDPTVDTDPTGGIVPTVDTDPQVDTE